MPNFGIFFINIKIDQIRQQYTLDKELNCKFNVLYSTNP